MRLRLLLPLGVARRELTSALCVTAVIKIFGKHQNEKGAPQRPF